MTRRSPGPGAPVHPRFALTNQHVAMPPSSPSDLFWTALSPLLQQLEALGHVLEACATYYAWCIGCTAGLAVLLLAGLVLKEARRGDGEQTGGQADPEESGAPARPPSSN
jgi:hypothetical protein